MAFSLNRAQIIGNLTRDPEVRTTPGSQKVASFGVATNLTWTDQAGQKKEKVEYHNVVAWRKLAEICEQYLRKGRKVFVEGRLQTRDWEGEDGVKRFRTEIVADSLIILDRAGTPDAAQIPQEKGALKNPTTTPKASDVVEEEVNLEDLPF